MGNLCVACCEPNAISNPNLVDMDPPAPADYNDIICKWEVTLPFAKCSMSAYSHCLEVAHAASGNDGFVTFQALASQFNSLAWADIRNKKSALWKFLAKNLAHESSSELQPKLDYEKLVAMGLLLCQDAVKPKVKAKAMFSLLQGENSAHQHISAGDKDWKPLLENLFSLSTVLFIEGANVKALYTEAELDSLKDKFYEVGEENDSADALIDCIFEFSAKIKTTEFIEVMTSEKAMWAFSPYEIRQRVF